MQIKFTYPHEFEAELDDLISCAQQEYDEWKDKPGRIKSEDGTFIIPAVTTTVNGYKQILATNLALLRFIKELNEGIICRKT